MPQLFFAPRRRLALMAAALALFCSGTNQAQTTASADAQFDLPLTGFFRHPVGPRGLEFTDALRAADGRQVRLTGYMVAQEQPAAGRFLLTPRPVRMSEHADGEADDLPPATVTVLLDAGQQDRIVPHQDGLLALTGTLQVGRAEGPDGRVSWVRLRLDPQALAAHATPPQP